MNFQPSFPKLRLQFLIVGLILVFFLIGCLHQAFAEDVQPAKSPEMVLPQKQDDTNRGWYQAPGYVGTEEGGFIGPQHFQAKSCSVYLKTCESSCSSRGSMLRFSCTGTDYQVSGNTYQCKCGDDLAYARSQESRR